MADKETLRKKFLSESFIDEAEPINITGWDKHLSHNEKRHINTMGLDSSQAKEKLAVENRIQDNQTNIGHNQEIPESLVRKAKQVAFEVEEGSSKADTGDNNKNVIDDEIILAREIAQLEEKLAAEEVKEVIDPKEEKARRYGENDLD